MTEAVLAFGVEEALKKVLSCITEEIKLAWGLSDELNRLRDSSAMVRDLLQDADEQQMMQMAVRRWLKKLKLWAYDAEDLLDGLAYEVLHRKMEMKYLAEARVPCFECSNGFHFVHNTAFRIKMAHKVKTVSESLDKIKNEAAGFGLSVTSANRNLSQPSLDPATDSMIDHPVVAREAEVFKIVDLMSGCRDQQALTVVAIVGMGGIGKTTVAKLVCKEAMEKKLFDVKMWVCVSTDLDDQRVLSEMLQTLNKNAGGITNKDAILQHLAEELAEKSFLLVLDNVWDQQIDRWASLKSRLTSINKKSGNAVVVTTRSERVALLMETSPQYRCKPNLLSDDDSWSIIRGRVFGESRKSIPSDLESIGKEIASKCKGLPLAARVLGGTLSQNPSIEGWSSIENSNVLNVSASEVSIESILRLSFDRLPFHLKPCVSYCSIFPRGVFISKGELIDQWMSHGLLDSSSEETGEKYFNELIHSSFLVDVRHNEFGIIDCARMHDLVHELALSISKSDILTIDNCSAGNDMSHIQHLNVLPVRTGQVAPIPLLRNNKTKALRTLFAESSDVLCDSFKFKSLRVLKLRGPNVKSLPAKIGKLKHLRFIDVSGSEITALPESITKLYNLQLLRVVECKQLGELPRRLKDLVNLRHLGFTYEKQMPKEVGCLRNLQFLTFFAVGPDRGCNIEQLEPLNELRYGLRITNLQLVKDEEEARKAQLHNKRKIGKLGFVWSSERDTSNYNDENVLEGLQPFKDLEALGIENYMGENFPSWLLTMKGIGLGGGYCTLNNMVKLNLRGCRRCGQLPSLGHLSLLKDLEIVGLDNVRYMDDEFYGSTIACTSNERRFFPALKRLVIDSMKSLVEWKAPTTFDVFPCLEVLLVSNCPKLRTIPISHLSSLVDFRLVRCDEFGELSFDEGHPLTSLRLLWIERCANFVSFQSVQGLTSLHVLKIKSCDELESLPRGLKCCSSLRTLEVMGCLKLASVPEDLLEMPSLDVLLLLSCPNVRNFGQDILQCLTQLRGLGFSCDNGEAFNSIQCMPSLDWLTIAGRDDFKSLPDQIRRLTALKTLHIVGFNRVEALPEWLDELSSLEYLEIWDCKKLKYLPSAAALRSLSLLKVLKIENCPVLRVSCAKGSGSEWPKISHIPKIIMDKALVKAN